MGNTRAATVHVQWTDNGIRPGKAWSDVVEWLVGHQRMGGKKMALDPDGSAIH